jgi:tetratricopeptide (TPR) repeat protein
MSGKYSEEVQHLRELYAKSPESRLFAPLADAYRKNGELDKAIEICERGLDRHPSYASAHVVLGKCYYDKGATERARSEFLRVIELDAENLVALKFLGDIQLAEGDQGSAVRYYEQLLAIDPTNEEVARSLGELEKGFRARKIDLSDDEKVTKAKDSGEIVTMTLAGIYAAQGYYNKALKIYRDIIRKEPGNEQAREMVAKLETMMSTSEEERKDAFGDDALTISLDDVGKEVASSTVGAGGIEEAADDAGETEPAGPPLAKKDEELAEAMRELERMEEETPGESAEAVSDEPVRDERPEAEGGAGAAEEMRDFKEWLQRLKSERDDD